MCLIIRLIEQIQQTPHFNIRLDNFTPDKGPNAQETWKNLAFNGNTGLVCATQSTTKQIQA